MSNKIKTYSKKTFSDTDDDKLQHRNSQDAVERKVTHVPCLHPLKSS